MTRKHFNFFIAKKIQIDGDVFIYSFLCLFVLFWFVLFWSPPGSCSVVTTTAADGAVHIVNVCAASHTDVCFTVCGGWCGKSQKDGRRAKRLLRRTGTNLVFK